MAVPNKANPNDSAHPGWEQATEPAGALTGQIGAGNTLVDYLQQWVAGVANLDGTLVRPRWQPEPPNLPDLTVDWASVGITRRSPIGPYSATIRHPEGDGYDEMQRHEEFELACTFYGPRAEEVASNFHDGLQTWWNYAPLRLVGVAYIEVQASIMVPELIRMQWWNRVDKVVVMRRIIRRNYPVLNLLEANGWVMTDGATTYAAHFHSGPAPYVTPHRG